MTVKVTHSALWWAESVHGALYSILQLLIGRSAVGRNTEEGLLQKEATVKMKRGSNRAP